MRKGCRAGCSVRFTQGPSAPLTVVVDVAQDAQQLPGAGAEAVERVRAVGVGQQQPAGVARGGGEESG